MFFLYWAAAIIVVCLIWKPFVKGHLIGWICLVWVHPEMALDIIIQRFHDAFGWLKNLRRTTEFDSRFKGTYNQNPEDIYE